jgi:hypothetical protein
LQGPEEKMKREGYDGCKEREKPDPMQPERNESGKKQKKKERKGKKSKRKERSNNVTKNKADECM